MESSIIITVRRLLRFSFTVIYSVQLLACVLAFTKPFFTPQERLMLIALTTTTSLVFVISHMLFEGRARVSCFTTEFSIYSSLMIIWLQLPSIYIILRHQIFSVSFISTANFTFLLIIGLTLGVPFRKISTTKKALFKLLDHSKKIMWYYEATTVNKDHDHKVIRAWRRKLYENKAIIECFQKSLSTPELDSKAALSLLKEKPWFKSASTSNGIHVLDIGGAEGLFTKNILEGLYNSGIKANRITLLDPIDWTPEYKNNISKIDPEIRIDHILGSLDSLGPSSKFDLVIASHSLYSMCDNSDVEDRTQAINEILDRVLSHRREDGSAVIAMASAKGHSYLYKSAALKFIFGNKINDVCAEDFKLASSLRLASTKTVDNFIDLSKFLDTPEYSSLSDIYEWTSYFIRYPVNGANKAEKNYLTILLHQHAESFESLSEADKPIFRHLSLHPVDSDLVLRHKVQVWVV